MTEDEVRTLVRTAIARARGAAPSHLAPSGAPSHLAASHSSHLVLAVPSGGEEAGPCIIEPSVSCNHCGYCKSLGH